MMMFWGAPAAEYGTFEHSALMAAYVQKERHAGGIWEYNAEPPLMPNPIWHVGLERVASGFF